MFGLFKNKKKQKEKADTVAEEALTEEQKEYLMQEIEKVHQEIKSANKEDNEHLASLYEKLGLNQAKLNENDQAIASLEKSLEYKLSIGDGYKKLMSLYNAKRAEAAKQGDDSGIDFYMNKMDEMRQIAKKVTISR
mgnify:CR=1 FL=1